MYSLNYRRCRAESSYLQNHHFSGNKQNCVFFELLNIVSLKLVLYLILLLYTVVYQH